MMLLKQLMQNTTLYIQRLIGFIQKQTQLKIDRCVTYNYGEQVWYTSSLARTTYADQGVFDLPYATEYSTTATPNFSIQGITNLAGASTYYAHESGADQVNSSGTLQLMRMYYLEI
jgi:hypothetical protein